MNRDLDANERLYWLFNQCSPNNVIAVAELDRELDPARLERALARLQARHPFLQRRILPDAQGGHPRFVRRGTGALPLRVVEDRTLHVVLEEELNEHLDPSAGLARACYVRQAGRSCVVVTCLHVVADATAAMLALRDLLLAYASEAQDFSGPALEALPGIEQLFPRERRGARALPSMVRGQLRALGDQLRNRPARLPPQADIAVQQRLNRFIRHELPLDPIRAACAAQGVSVHALLMAALALAIARELRLRLKKHAPLSVGSPVSLRSELGRELTDDLGSYVCTLDVHLDVGAAHDIWSIARQAKQELERRRGRAEHVAMLNLVHWITPESFADSARTLGMIEARGPGNSCVSNIGSFELPRSVADAQVLSAHWTASLSITGYMLCAVCSVHERLQLDFTYLEGVVSPERAARIVADVLAELAMLKEKCA